MEKILDLGPTISGTEEPRISLIENNELTKTASNEIRRQWDTLKPNPDKAYLHILAMTAEGWYTNNNNGDSFAEEDLKKYHPSFITSAKLYKHHVNKDPLKSYGDVLFSYYNEGMHRVELIVDIVKKKSPEVIAKIKNNEPIAVSMGARMKFDVCSICGNRAKTRAFYCDHLRFNMNKILPDGRQVYAKNPGPLTFFDISLVTRPADRTAWALQKIASTTSGEEVPITSAQRGEYHASFREKLAAIRKMADMIKEIEGTPVALKDGKDDTTYSLKNQIDKIKIPLVDADQLNKMPITPGGIMRIFLRNGAPPSIGEYGCAVGKHFLKDKFDPKSMLPIAFKALPSSLNFLARKPSMLGQIIKALMGNYGGELEGDGAEDLLSVVRPVIKERIIIIKTAMDQAFEKEAAQVLSQLEVNTPGITGLPKSPFAGVRNTKNTFDQDWRSSSPPVTDVFTVNGSDGRQYVTSRFEARMAAKQEDAPREVKQWLGFLLGVAAVGAAISDKKLSTKLLVAPALALAAAPLITGGKKAPRVRSLEGAEIPVSSAFRVKHAMEKEARFLTPVLGAAVPATFGLDYMYNKHVKYRNDPYYRQNLSQGNNYMDRAGQAVVNNPIKTLGGGALVALALRSGRGFR